MGSESTGKIPGNGPDILRFIIGQEKWSDISPVYNFAVKFNTSRDIAADPERIHFAGLTGQPDIEGRNVSIRIEGSDNRYNGNGLVIIGCVGYVGRHSDLPSFLQR